MRRQCAPEEHPHIGTYPYAHNNNRLRRLVDHPTRLPPHRTVLPTYRLSPCEPPPHSQPPDSPASPPRPTGPVGHFVHQIRTAPALRARIWCTKSISALTERCGQGPGYRLSTREPPPHNRPPDSPASLPRPAGSVGHFVHQIRTAPALRARICCTKSISALAAPVRPGARPDSAVLALSPSRPSASGVLPSDTRKEAGTRSDVGSAVRGAVWRAGARTPCPGLGHLMTCPRSRHLVPARCSRPKSPPRTPPPTRPPPTTPPPTTPTGGRSARVCAPANVAAADRCTKPGGSETHGNDRTAS